MINPKMIEDISRVAAKVAIDHLEKERTSQKKYMRDRRVRNTRMLLKHYRSFKQHCEDVKNELDELTNLEMSEDLDSDDFAVHSIKKSKERTLRMVRFIDQMLEIYQITSERSSNPLHQRQFKTIEAIYISDEEMTVEQISEKSDIDTRTVYRDIQEAVYALSSLIFGVDGIRMI